MESNLCNAGKWKRIERSGRDSCWVDICQKYSAPGGVEWLISFIGKKLNRDFDELFADVCSGVELSTIIDRLQNKILKRKDKQATEESNEDSEYVVCIVRFHCNWVCPHSLMNVGERTLYPIFVETQWCCLVWMCWVRWQWLAGDWEHMWQLCLRHSSTVCPWCFWRTQHTALLAYSGDTLSVYASVIVYCITV